MTTETLSISIKSGTYRGSDYVSNVDDTQYVTLTDGGDITSVKIAGFGTRSPSEAGEGPGGDDEFHTDLSSFDDDYEMTVNSFDEGDTFFFTKAVSWSNVGNFYTINYIGSDSDSHDMSIDAESGNGTGVATVVITCFAEGMNISTPEGPVAVEMLSVGDQVLCGDHQFRPIRWTSARHINKVELARHPEYRPVRIRKGAFGQNKPNADLVVSPQHRILIDDWRAELMFGQPVVLVAAVHMIDDKNILRDYTSDCVSYYHFMFDEHQTVWSNGMRTESFYPGMTAIEGVQSAARNELLSLFPDLALNTDLYGQTCHHALKAHEAHAMFGG